MLHNVDKCSPRWLSSLIKANLQWKYRLYPDRRKQHESKWNDSRYEREVQSVVYYFQTDNIHQTCCFIVKYVYHTENVFTV